jgi:hypothetical protein
VASCLDGPLHGDPSGGVFQTTTGGPGQEIYFFSLIVGSTLLADGLLGLLGLLVLGKQPGSAVGWWYTPLFIYGWRCGEGISVVLINNQIHV